MPESVPHVFWNRSSVTPDARRLRYGQDGRIVWFTGLSGSGKSTLANELERQLYLRGRHVYLLDGDNLRHGLCSDLGFSAADRGELKEFTGVSAPYEPPLAPELVLHADRDSVEACVHQLLACLGCAADAGATEIQVMRAR